MYLFISLLLWHFELNFLGLPELANKNLGCKKKNLGCAVKFEFPININKFLVRVSNVVLFPCNIWDILYQNSTCCLSEFLMLLGILYFVCQP